jgi:hypothetical protein
MNLLKAASTVSLLTLVAHHRLGARAVLIAAAFVRRQRR